MHDASDMELLRDYGCRNSEAAFAEVVQRHIGLVYSAAFRHTENSAHAEEITQAVFIILARKAAGLRANTILEGWLYETTRLTALGFLRGERRRQFREQEAYMQSTAQENNDAATWNQLAPLLDEAVSRLGKKDRDALILRFFKDKSIRDVAAAKQVNEAAAQRRILRALEKLREFFTKHGVSSTTAIIAGAISANSVQAAPMALAKAVTAIAVAKGAAASGSTLTLIKGALKIIAWSKAKIVIAIVAGLILATSISVVVIQKESLIQGQTEAQWIKSINYFGDDNQTKRWRSLGTQGVKMLVRAMKSPAYDHSTRMCVVSLISQLGNDAKSAIPDIINQIKIEKDIGVLQIELGYFEGPLQTMSEKGKAALLPELLHVMQSEDASVRNNALVALQFYPDQSDTVIPLMVSSLQDSDSDVRLMAAKALNQIDPQTATKSDIVRVVVECSTNSNTANNAIIMLGELHREPDLAIPALVQGLQSNESYIRNNSAAALGRFGILAKPAVAALTKALGDSDQKVRLQATAALKRINSGAVPK